jgi:hypothetical protein
MGQASLETPKNICTSECFAKVEFGLLVTDMSLVPKSFMYRKECQDLRGLLYFWKS